MSGFGLVCGHMLGLADLELGIIQFVGINSPQSISIAHTQSLMRGYCAFRPEAVCIASTESSGGRWANLERSKLFAVESGRNSRRRRRQLSHPTATLGTGRERQQARVERSQKFNSGLTNLPSREYGPSQRCCFHNAQSKLNQSTLSIRLF